MNDLIPLVKTSEVSEGQPVPVSVEGLPALAVYRLGNEFYITDNLCTHGAARLSDGFLEDGQIECPLHQGRFDVCTGKAMCAPLTQDVRCYPVRIVNQRVFLKFD